MSMGTPRDFWDPTNGAGYWAGSEYDRSGPQGGDGRVGGPRRGGSTGGGQRSAGGGGRGGGRQQAREYSPLGDPEFFSNSEVRNYCENARSGFMQMAFEIVMAAEVLEEVLREVPDSSGKPWGSRARARRVAKRLAKSGDALTSAAANVAATYAAFQREYSPELEPVRARQQRPRRSFTFDA